MMFKNRYTQCVPFGFFALSILFFVSPASTFAGGDGEGPPPGAVLGVPVIVGEMKVKVDKDNDLLLHVKFKGRCGDSTDITETVKFKWDAPDQTLLTANDFALATAEDMATAINGQLVTGTLVPVDPLLNPPHPCWNGITVPPSFVMFVKKVLAKTEKVFLAKVVLLNYATP